MNGSVAVVVKKLQILKKKRKAWVFAQTVAERMRHKYHLKNLVNGKSFLIKIRKRILIYF